MREHKLSWHVRTPNIKDEWMEFWSTVQQQLAKMITLIILIKWSFAKFSAFNIQQSPNISLHSRTRFSLQSLRTYNVSIELSIYPKDDKLHYIFYIFVLPADYHYKTFLNFLHVFIWFDFGTDRPSNVPMFLCVVTLWYSVRPLLDKILPVQNITIKQIYAALMCMQFAMFQCFQVSVCCKGKVQKKGEKN